MTKKNDTTDDSMFILLKPHKKGKFAVGVTSDYVADTSEKEMCKMVALGVAQLLLEDPDPFYERGIEIAAQLDNMDIADVSEFVKENDESNIVDLTRYLDIKKLN
tara:strand:+ start:65 stop:379 length:315 start_codon:yes stop_codon:yes gene_type:complete